MLFEHCLNNQAPPCPALKQELPPNPLDQLIELLGGEEAVAELTGAHGGCAGGREEDVLAPQFSEESLPTCLQSWHSDPAAAC